jgi:hypothetical protein
LEERETSGGIEEEGEGGFKKELKLGQVPLLRCSEAVLDGFEAEKEALHKQHFSFTALGRLVSGFRTIIGSRCAQYHAPFPLIALFLTVTRPSYLLFMAFMEISSAVVESAIFPVFQGTLVVTVNGLSWKHFLDSI